MFVINASGTVPFWHFLRHLSADTKLWVCRICADSTFPLNTHLLNALYVVLHMYSYYFDLDLYYRL